jgi:transposase, IS5 family
MTFAAAKGFEVHGRTTRKAQFLARMESLVPWSEFCALIEPHYRKAGNERPPKGLERMLRMYLVANWFNLADEACEEALHDVPAVREFCRIDLGRERVPNATTLLQFRHLLERHEIGAGLFAKVGQLLQANGLKLCGGTIVDPTLIAAPPSTKNEAQSRDPEMHRSKKAKQWHFRMKVHIGVDSQSGLIHSASVTAGNVHDSQELPNLLRGQETRLYGDSAYRGKKQRRNARKPHLLYCNNRPDYVEGLVYRADLISVSIMCGRSHRLRPSTPAARHPTAAEDAWHVGWLSVPTWHQAP